MGDIISLLKHQIFKKGEIIRVDTAHCFDTLDIEATRDNLIAEMMKLGFIYIHNSSIYEQQQDIQ